MGPIGVFFLAFQFGGDLLAVPVLHDTMSLLTGPAVLSGEGGPLFLATALFMLAIGLSLGTSWSLTRQLPRMAVLTGIVVVVFGGLTLALGSETFIKMKPTVVNALFALILGVGLLRGQSYLKYPLGQTMPLDDAGWMIFTRRWVMFFVFLAALNEVVWRS